MNLKLKNILILIFLMTSSLSFGDDSAKLKEAFPEPVQKFLEWEFHANTANNPSTRGNQYFQMKHFEFPLSELEGHFADTLDPKIRKALIFTKDNQEWIRWVVNSEDTSNYLKVESWLKGKGLDATLKSRFVGALTSSRSMLVSDPKSGAIFSIKVGTNKTGGNWQDKGVNRNQVVKARLANDIQENVERRFAFKNLVIQLETAGGVIADIDHGFIVRELGDDFVSGKKYYLPGFSALNEAVGESISKTNGANNPAKFWTKHYHAPLGKASAEMFSFMGLTFQSAHSQQYLIELDKNMKPTGKIVFRDIADSWAMKPFFEKFEKKFPGIIEIWLNEYMNTNLRVATGTLHGMSNPSWITREIYEDMNKVFFKNFDHVVSEITRVPISSLSPNDISHSFSFSYAQKAISPDGVDWSNYLDNASCYQGATTMANGTLCTEAVSFLDKIYVKESSKCFDAYLLKFLY